MIRLNTLFDKAKSVKNSSEELFQPFLEQYLALGILILKNMSCAYCGAASAYAYRKHGYYRRLAIDYINGLPVAKWMWIPRVKCGCGHTHGLLPDTLIPYSRYSVFYALQAINEYLNGHHTKVYVCTVYGVSYYVLTRWLSLWKTNSREWLGVLEAKVEEQKQLMDQIYNKMSWSKFAREFTKKTGMSFLQSHKNPERYVRKTADPCSCST